MNYSDWMRKTWRPGMGFVYMLICIFDFVIGPILWTLAQAMFGGAVATPWVPLTLGSSGLFHMAMGAVLGVSAWTRGNEKVEALRQGKPIDGENS